MNKRIAAKMPHNRFKPFNGTNGAGVSLTLFINMSLRATGAE